MTPGQIAAAVAAALIAAGAVYRRRTLGTERLLFAALAVVALTVFATGLLSELPDPERFIEGLAETLGAWTYVLVGTMAFLETGAFVGLVAPGEFTVILGGVVAGQGEIDIVPLIGLVWVCAVLGDSTSFLIGQRLGRSFLLKHGPRVKITRERLEQVERYLGRHGGKTIVIGRFIGLVRALAPFVAGSSRMPYPRFLPYSIIGTGLWAGTFCVLGYVFYRSFSQVADIAGRATIAFGLVVGVIVGVVVAYRRLRHEEERRRLGAWFERQGERPLLRPLAFVIRPVWRRAVRPAWRFAAPQLRFVWGRLTPGELGIEFTTAVAIAAGGLYVFGLGAVTLTTGDNMMFGDRQVLRFAREIRIDAGVDVVKLVTELAAFPVVAALTLAAAALLAWKRQPLELIALVTGLVLVYIGVQLGKAGVDRPRPAAGLVDTEGASYPSGHAAYATAYVALGVVAARVLPGLVLPTAFVGTLIGVVAALGLTRVYLQVHWFSDVAGGWGLGLGVYGGCAAVALLVAHMRENERARRAASGARATPQRTS